MMAVAYLGLGSNLGDRLGMVCAALARLAMFGDVASSSVYETEPWGDQEQPRYLNLCCRLATTLSARGLHRAIKRIERDLGRQPSRRWGPREIDIDLLAYESLELRTAALTIPHPRIAQRAFVLAPLAEIAPNLHIPGLPGSVSEQLARLPGVEAQVRIVAPPPTAVPRPGELRGG